MSTETDAQRLERLRPRLILASHLTMEDKNWLLAQAERAQQQSKAVAPLMGDLTAAVQRNEELRAALEALVEARWMVTHDWGGDYDAVMDKARRALEQQP